MKTLFRIFLFAICTSPVLLSGQQTDRTTSFPSITSHTVRNSHNRDLPEWRPVQERFSNWNSFMNSWDLYSLSTYTYDNAQLSQSVLAYPSGPTILQRSTFTYNAAGKKETEITQGGDGVTWTNLSKQVTLYANNGFETGYETWNWDGSVWVLMDGQRRSDEYASGNLVLATQEAYDNSLMLWQPYLEYVVSYSPSNRMDVVTIRTADITPGVFVNAQRFDFSYLGSSVRPDSAYIYDWDVSAWIISQRAFDLQWNDQYIPLLESEPLAYVMQELFDGTWYNAERMNTTPAAGGFVQLVEVDTDGAWVPESRETTEADLYANRTLDKYEIYDGVNWNISDMSVYTNSYDAEQRLIRIEAQLWNNNTQALQNNYLREFIEFIDIAGTAEISANSLKLYPNPCQNACNLSVSGGTISAIEIVDLTGRILIRKSVAPCVQMQADVQDLPVGMYLIRVQTSDGVRTVNFVKAS